MTIDPKLQIVVLLTVGFAYASIFGALAARFKLPVILGYLIAGYLIGPYSPGFVVDVGTSEQLAEIGVVLMLFGVGLHFKLEDLLNVKQIAIPGALFQTAVSSIAGAYFVHLMGWPLTHGVILGLSISVASTVVLVRMLIDNKLQDTFEGHIAVGWLIVEDILTVAMLVLLPTLALFWQQGELPLVTIGESIVAVLVKFAVLCFLVVVWGYRVVSFLLTYISRFRSQELFTLAVLALTFVIATGSTAIFGTSIALGAFLAGICIGQTEVRHQAFADALPLRAMFAVIFFLSIGMLFNPMGILAEWQLFLGILGVILLIKPLAAYALVRIMHCPTRVACIVSCSLMQIGEFSFILAEQASSLHLFSDAGYDIIVGAAFVSIALNPILFRLMLKFIKERKVTKSIPESSKAKIKELAEARIALPEVIIVGFGPIGQKVAEFYERKHISPVILEHNIDTAIEMRTETRRIVYGDAASEHVLEVSMLSKESLLVSTVPDLATQLAIIQTAKRIHPEVKIVARIQYISEKALMEDLGADYVCAEEELARAFLEKVKRLS